CAGCSGPRWPAAMGAAFEAALDRAPVDAGGARMSSASRFRVLIVDDHDVVHWGLRSLLSSQAWVERCLAAHSGDEGVELAQRYKPHVALVDLYLGGASGAEVCSRLIEAQPSIKVLLI